MGPIRKTATNGHAEFCQHGCHHGWRQCCPKDNLICVPLPSISGSQGVHTPGPTLLYIPVLAHSRTEGHHRTSSMHDRGIKEVESRRRCRSTPCRSSDERGYPVRKHKVKWKNHGKDHGTSGTIDQHFAARSAQGRPKDRHFIRGNSMVGQLFSNSRVSTLQQIAPRAQRSREEEFSHGGLPMFPPTPALSPVTPDNTHRRCGAPSSERRHGSLVE